MKPRYWLLSYDIGHPNRLRRVAKLALDHGERIQKSLYLGALNREQVDLLHDQFSEIIEPTDRLMLRPVCRYCRYGTRFQGAGHHFERQEPFWIV